MREPELTISIVSHGQGQLIRRLLLDLQRVAGFELILTLNIPEDERFLDHAPAGLSTVIRNPTPKGFGANHNAAFKLCRTPWFAVLNPDLRLIEDPFPSLRQTSTRLCRPGAVAPRIVDSGGCEQDFVRTSPTPWSVAARLFNRSVGQASGEAMQGGLDNSCWLAGMFLMFASSAFSQLGGFDERFFLYYEDFDICARLRREGFDIAVDQSVTVVHDAQRSSRRSFRHLRWHVASLLRVWTSRVFWSTFIASRNFGSGLKGSK